MDYFEKSFNLLDPFRVAKYKIDFNKNHPLYFRPSGCIIFSGPQGSGKTLSAVDYVYKVLADYPLCVCVSNTALTDYPFNAYLSDDDKQLHFITSNELITPDRVRQELARDPDFRVCVEYWGLDSLKYVSNGEYGVIFLIDEIHLELNSLESKNIDINVMVEISQQRKQRKHIVGTSQVFMRMAKPLREQMYRIIVCKPYFGILQWNTVCNGTTCYEKNGEVVMDIITHSFFFHSPDKFKRYDTFAKMRRYNQEWNGKAQEPYNFFVGGSSNKQIKHKGMGRKGLG